jgi:hypothetical protein
MGITIYSEWDNCMGHEDYYEMWEDEIGRLHSKRSLELPSRWGQIYRRIFMVMFHKSWMSMIPANWDTGSDIEDEDDLNDGVVGSYEILALEKTREMLLTFLKSPKEIDDDTYEYTYCIVSIDRQLLNAKIVRFVQRMVWFMDGIITHKDEHPVIKAYY